MTGSATDRFFVAIDVDTLDEAKKLMDSLAGLVTHVKFGLQLATHEGWKDCIAAAHERGLKVFCDAKFKDIPNTLEHAAYALAKHQPDFFTVMADNSLDALRAIRAGVDRAAAEPDQTDRPKIIGVTVLTSIDEKECRSIYGDNTNVKVQLFGSNAVAAGLDAVVCSPEEIELFRKDKKFDQTMIITPGVRPTWASSDDQSRVTTPAEAIKRGADMLVIGRPITQPPAEVGSVEAAVRRIVEEIEEAQA